MAGSLGGLGANILGVFVLKRSLWALFLGPFPHAKTTYKFLWNSKNVTNITKALNMQKVHPKHYKILRLCITEPSFIVISM